VRRPPAWYLLVLAASASLRLRELAISRSHERVTGGEPSAPATYPLMVAAHVGLHTLPLLEVPPGRRPDWRWALVLAGSLGLRLWCIRSLGKQWNVRALVPRDLVPVETGPYRYVRHPNYVAVILEFLAVPLIAGAGFTAGLLSAVNAYVLYDRIRAEEALLDASPAYRDAFAGKARFIPGVF
jgi:methyltransferase